MDRIVKKQWIPLNRPIRWSAHRSSILRFLRWPANQPTNQLLLGLCLRHKIDMHKLARSRAFKLSQVGRHDATIVHTHRNKHLWRKFAITRRAQDTAYLILSRSMCRLPRRISAKVSRLKTIITCPQVLRHYYTELCATVPRPRWERADPT